MKHRLIDTSTAAQPTGNPTGRQLFRVENGPFAGRLFALYSRTASAIAWTWADPPYSTWQDPVDAVADSDDLPFAGLMDEAGHVYIIYTRAATGALVAQKLVFASGTWTAQSPATIYDSLTSINRHPTVLKDLYGRIWVAWSSDDTGTMTWRVKRSIDDAATFGSGDSDPGTDLSGDVTEVYGLLIARGTSIHMLFTTDGDTLWHRSIGLDDLTWASADALYGGSNLSAELQAAVSADGMLGAIFAADDRILFREFDGVSWRPVVEVTDSEASSPAILYIGNTPHALFLAMLGNDQREYRTCKLSGGVFTEPLPALSQIRTFDRVLLLDADAALTYADLTSEAADAAPADVFHPTNGALLADPGDTLYMGGEDRFSFIHVILSTTGTDGTVAWSYWDGSSWQEFTPESGSYHFTSTPAPVRLFVDGASIPTMWQKLTIAGYSRFWIRAIVQTGFTVAPIGTQLTAISLTGTILPLRG